MLPEKYRKRSFLRFDVPLDMEGLVREYKSIPDEAWSTSYWLVHNSIGTLLLRGGDSGTEMDYQTDSVVDHPLLADMPTFRALLSEEGPFGRPEYAYLFSMVPDGMTLEHEDEASEWEDMYRLHIPLETNPGALLISGERCMHFSKGHVWTFDNISNHGVVNGPEQRTHLIFDVPFNEKLAKALDRAVYLEGEPALPGDLEKIRRKKEEKKPYPGDQYIAKAIKHIRVTGLNDSAIAAAFNSMGIPTKQYARDKSPDDSIGWDGEMIASFRPDIDQTPTSDLDHHVPPNEVLRLANILYFRSMVFERTHWMGIKTMKCPMDMWVYQEMIVNLKTDLLIETGTFAGGSALFFAQLFDMLGRGRVITIDIDGHDNTERPQHSRIEYVSGSSIDPDVVDRLKVEAEASKSVMVILDSDHHAKHKLMELELYSPLVTVGNYIIAEDSCFDAFPAWPEFGLGPAAAVREFLMRHNNFEVDRSQERHMITFSPMAFLKKIRSSSSATGP